MKFLHVADLHIGKRVKERSMLDEQEHAFGQMHAIAAGQDVDAVIVAGDVFDRPTPGKDALELCERFYAGFIDRGIPVLVIPGNHDGAQQVAFCSAMTAAAGLHVARAYDGGIQVVRLEDEYGPVDVHLLPFVRPTDVRMALPERADEVKSHDDAVRIALERHPLAADARHVLVAHQFVVDGGRLPQTCESETISVGGIDSVQAAHFDAFDYVALGHLHGAQSVRRPEVRYSGSPVKYSFSESKQTKTASVVHLGPPAPGGARVDVCDFELHPIRDMRELRGSFEELAARSGDPGCSDYLHITLTDRSVYEALRRLRTVYPNLLQLDWSDADAGGSDPHPALERMRAGTPEQLFGDFYRLQTGEGLDEEQVGLVRDLLAAQEAAR